MLRQAGVLIFILVIGVIYGPKSAVASHLSAKAQMANAAVSIFITSLTHYKHVPIILEARSDQRAFWGGIIWNAVNQFKAKSLAYTKSDCAWCQCVGRNIVCNQRIMLLPEIYPISTPHDCSSCTANVDDFYIGIQFLSCHDWGIWKELMEADNKYTPNFQARSMRSDELTVSKINGSFQLDSLPAKYEQLARGDERQSDGGPEKTLSEFGETFIIRRFLLFAFSLSGGLFLFIIGWQHFYNNRKLLGAALIGCGLLCGIGGLGYWWLNAFPATWGWPL